MPHPAPETVVEQLKTHNRVPVYQSFVSDKLTPVSAYLNLSRGTDLKGFLLESVEKGQNIARYSFLGVNPSEEIIWNDNGPQGQYESQSEQFNSPFELLDSVTEQWSAPTPDSLPGFTGGIVGYLGYELVKYIESSVPTHNQKDPQYSFPDLYMFLVDNLIIFDHVKRMIYVVGHVRSKDEPLKEYERVTQDLTRLKNQLKTFHDAPDIYDANRNGSPDISSNFTSDNYEEAVREIKEKIRAGEIFQAVLSQRLHVNSDNHPFNLYRSLRSLNPSPYMFYLDFNDYKLVGSSPEILVQKENKKVRVRPIAGTRPRGNTESEDSKLARELQEDEKERAEHTMLVDLGRNDIGRVCEPGTVNVTEREIIERYSHVMHMVSNVEGILRDQYGVIDILRATFPAGTVSGAPKVRAMQIIESLEPTRRGPYAGAVGYISYQRNLDTCIVIRTIASQGNDLYIQAGAGVVADSVPSREYEETREKAQALVNTVNTLDSDTFL